MITEHKAGFENVIQSGKTSQGGDVTFSSEKIKTIIFPIPFDSIPSVNITLESNSVGIPYKINVTKTGFQVKFNINFTGIVSWTAVKI